MVKPADHIVHFLLTRFDPSHNLAGFYALEGEDFIQLPFELGDEGLLVFFRPWSSFRVGVVRSRLGFVWCFECLFKLVVRDVIVVVVSN